MDQQEANFKTAKDLYEERLKDLKKAATTYTVLCNFKENLIEHKEIEEEEKDLSDEQKAENAKTRQAAKKAKDAEFDEALEWALATAQKDLEDSTNRTPSRTAKEIQMENKEKGRSFSVQYTEAKVACERDLFHEW